MSLLEHPHALSCSVSLSFSPLVSFSGLVWMLSRLDAAIPLNKQLYTFSYVCVTAGAAALVFSAFYILVCMLCLILESVPISFICMCCFCLILEAAPLFYDRSYTVPNTWFSVFLFVFDSAFCSFYFIWSFDLVKTLYILAGRHLEVEVLIPSIQVDWHERHAGLCNGSRRHLCRIYKWVVLQRPPQYTGLPPL